jgi:hypothetical protein
VDGLAKGQGDGAARGRREGERPAGGARVAVRGRESGEAAGPFGYGFLSLFFFFFYFLSLYPNNINKSISKYF